LPADLLSRETQKPAAFAFEWTFQMSEFVGEHFEFGANWTRFLELVDEPRIARATSALQTLLGVDRMDGRAFLDVGSGSGLSSLAAHRLGAKVHSFDYDPQSVACTREMKRRFAPGATDWTIEPGSALDAEYLAKLGKYDIVYSWGVLHHTGQMWLAIDLVQERVNPGGLLVLAIYNDQGQSSQRWRQVKALYQKLPQLFKGLLVVLVGAGMLLRRLCATFISTVLRLVMLRNPLLPTITLAKDMHKSDHRGMSRWHDLVDWVGGWPFEVATPEAVFRRLRDHGFTLQEMTTCGGGLGCNEFVFKNNRDC
jgi:2-polyprenyl-6-hydroxyphenyl methylase/3-demethylubiquinone-9 3-methyltransferase